MSAPSEPKIPLRELLHKMWGPYKRLLPYLKPYRVRFIAGLLCGSAASIASAAIPLTLRHVADAIFGPGNKPGMVEMATENTLANTPGIAVMLGVCIVIPIVMLARGIFGYLSNYSTNWVGFRILNDVRNDLFGKIIAQSMTFFNKQQSGMLIGRIMNDTRMAQMAFQSLSTDLVQAPVAVIASVGVLVYLDPWFTFISLCLFPTCLIPIIIFGKRVRKRGGEEEIHAAEMMVVLQEAFAGIRVIKALTREPDEIRDFEATGTKQFTVAMKVRRAMEIVHPIIECVSAVGVVFALIYVWSRGISAGTFLALVGGLFLMYDPVKRLSRVHLQIQKALASTERIFEMMSVPIEVTDAPDSAELDHVRGEMELENVTFNYNPANPDVRPAVQGLNLRIKPGKTYALVGQSGSGKSTVLSLLLRFYDPQSGVIKIDGHDLRNVTQASLRKHMAIVTQDTFLFHTSIIENIRYGRLDATDEAVYAAAQQAYAHDFICEQPHGYQTIVGDKGCMLSGGQQQRIAIARALLKDAPILLLDEATSALDSEAEKIIQLALDRLAKGRTVIAIAHRLSTILNADQIVSMSEGRIEEIGTHAELFERNGHYRRLYDLQFNNNL